MALVSQDIAWGHTRTTDKPLAGIRRGPAYCVNYDYTIKIKNYFKIMYKDFKM